MAVYAYLIKYYGSIQACSVAEPLDTITTKDRFALVTVQEEDYAVADIFMRFLTPRELFNATGFPEDYIPDCFLENSGDMEVLRETVNTWIKETIYED